MALCPCGTEVRWAPNERGAPVPLEAHEVSRGPGRYVERDGRLVAVRADADVLAFPDHRIACPRLGRTPKRLTG
jgi:hypothetical protein